jgi:replicative DNA helicase
MHDETSRTDHWEPPIPLGEATATVPFPTHVLPTYLREFVEAVAESTQTPPDLAAMLALGVVGTCVAGKAKIRAWGDWVEPTNLFVVVALPPANRKSAVISEVTAPLRIIEDREAKRLAPLIREATARLKVATKRASEAEKAASLASPGTDTDAAILQAVAAAKERDDIKVPLAPRFTVDDCTPEKLASLMGEHGGRMACISAEGGVFGLMAGRYSSNSAPNFDVYLKGHAGDPLQVDRIGRPADRVDRPALSVALAVQPDVIQSLADTPGFRGRGLLARFLYSVPRSFVGHRKSMTAAVPERVRFKYEAAMSGLLALDTPEPVPCLTLNSAATDALRRFVDGIEPQLPEDGGLGVIQDWAGKLQGATLRIAAILHMSRLHEAADPRAIQVDAATLEAAIAIADYLTDHARAAFGLMGADAAIAQARHLLGWIKNGNGEAFSERDAFNGMKGRFRNMDEFRIALNVLLQHRFIRRVEGAGPKGAGRPASPRYEINAIWWRSLRAQSA